ncbi:MAG: SH3 domain-containing protein [Nitrospinota bacterium]|nr:SH3 domain-containing protein [Nitrospinota bacterium]
MNFDEITQRESALIRDYCVSCNQSLPRGAAFCEHCGPPKGPQETQESGITFWQAMKRIVLMTLVFALIVIYKMDWDYQAFFSSSVESPPADQVREVPEDEDYELFHYVNVSFANIREKPDENAKIITGAGKGERLIILEKGEHWSQVKLGDKQGWIATRLLSSSIE